MKKALIGAAGAILFAGLLLWLTLGNRHYRVEVCIDFQGRQACRVASGASERTAVTTAANNACTVLASGMTDSMACERTPPSSVKWLERQ